MTVAQTLRILTCDDEVDFVETLVKRLARRGMAATGVNSGPDALAALDREEFDVVVLDVKMPGMNGIETLQEIKKRHPLVEVVMLTGHASVESGVQGMGLGAFDYLMKPVDFDDLVEMVRRAYQRKLLRAAKPG
jgi:DNA-binding NtrC family response regulator